MSSDASASIWRVTPPGYVHEYGDTRATRIARILKTAADRPGAAIPRVPILCEATMPERHFVKYTFLKVAPAWRRLDDAERARHKREFLAACEDFASERLLRAFSLVGTRGDADMMLLTQATNLERIHEFHVVLAQSGLMKWCETPYSYLAMTKPSEYSDESRLQVRPAHAKYLFVYPFVKTREWYRLPPDERWRIMQEHIAVGREFPQIDLNTSYSFGLDDQEFVVAFETDDPGSFLDLVQRLRTTESSSYTKRDTPTFTCVGVLGRAGVERARRRAADRRGGRMTTDAARRLRRGPRHHGDRRRTGRAHHRVLGRDAPGVGADHRLAAGARRPVHDAVSREVGVRRARVTRRSSPRTSSGCCASSRSSSSTSRCTWRRPPARSRGTTST